MCIKFYMHDINKLIQKYQSIFLLNAAQETVNSHKLIHSFQYQVILVTETF